MTDAREISYEEVVSELHARLGIRVMVGIGTIDGGYVAGTISGVLNRGQEVDVSAFFPSLLGDITGESLFFMIGEPGSPVGATFVLYKPGFQWGRLYDGMLGPTVAFAVEDIAVRVFPAPPISI